MHRIYMQIQVRFCLTQIRQIKSQRIDGGTRAAGAAAAAQAEVNCRTNSKVIASGSDACVARPLRRISKRISGARKMART